MSVEEVTLRLTANTERIELCLDEAGKIICFATEIVRKAYHSISTLFTDSDLP